jgi:hypothetical protein
MTAGKEGGLRNDRERWAQERTVELFDSSSDPIAARLASFSKYVRRQDLTAFLARYELFRRVVGIKGSVVECGVFRGQGLMTWAKLSAILEPNNIMRRIYGFDTFDGFPEVGEKDSTPIRETLPGELRSPSHDELLSLIEAYDADRFLGHVPKVSLIKGDATKTIPAFVEENQHVVVSLLFLDFDLFEPTRVALQNFLPRMPKGAVLAFDELDNPSWPGETLAMLEEVGAGRIRIERMDFDPYVGFAVLD